MFKITQSPQTTRTTKDRPALTNSVTRTHESLGKNSIEKGGRVEGVSCWWSQGFGCWGYPGEVSYRNECRGCMRTPCSTKKVEVRECSAREGPSTGDGSVSSTRTGVGRPCVGTKEGSDREDCARCTHLKHNLFARFTTCAKKQRTNANPPQGSNEINTKKHTTAHPDLCLDNLG